MKKIRIKAAGRIPSGVHNLLETIEEARAEGCKTGTPHMLSDKVFTLEETIAMRDSIGVILIDKDAGMCEYVDSEFDEFEIL